MPFAILTRELARAAPYAAGLTALGLDTIAMPLLEERPPIDPDALSRALSATRYAHIIVTSARAAAALAHAAVAAGVELTNLWAVGPATTEALRALGLHPIADDSVTDGASLARALIGTEAVAGHTFLFPRAEDGRDDGAAILRAAGAEVDVITAYRMIAIPAVDPRIARGRTALTSGHAPVCCVFAPSQVRALVALVGPLSALATRFIAIGHTTAAALRDAGLGDPAVASAPSPAALAAAVASVYPTRR